MLQDIDMYYDETDTPAMARTSNLNEELGQVCKSTTWGIIRDLQILRRVRLRGQDFSILSNTK